MSSDPAVTSAAVAVRNGTPILDALRFIGLDPNDWPLAVAALNRAERMRAEESEAQARQIAYHLARVLNGS